MSTEVLLLQLIILVIGDILLFPANYSECTTREGESERDENDDISYYRSSTHTARHLHSF